GDDIRRLAASGRGFGIVAGTGTGKTLAIRPIAATVLDAPLKVGVVNREREATPETATWNVVIVTTGIARRWFEDGLITARDTLVVDDRKSTRLNSSHRTISYAVFCLKKKKHIANSMSYYKDTSLHIDVTCIKL